MSRAPLTVVFEGQGERGRIARELAREVKGIVVVDAAAAAKPVDVVISFGDASDASDGASGSSRTVSLGASTERWAVEEPRRGGSTAEEVRDAIALRLRLLAQMARVTRMAGD